MLMMNETSLLANGAYLLGNSGNGPSTGVKWEIEIAYTMTDYTQNLQQADQEITPSMTFPATNTGAQGLNINTHLPHTPMGEVKTPTSTVKYTVSNTEKHVTSNNIRVQAAVTIKVSSGPAGSREEDEIQFTHDLDAAVMKVKNGDRTLEGLCGQADCSTPLVPNNTAVTLSGGKAAQLSYDDYFCEENHYPQLDTATTFDFELNATLIDLLDAFEGTPDLSDSKTGSYECHGGVPREYVNTTDQGKALNFDLGLAGSFATAPRRFMFDPSCEGCVGSLHVTVGTDTKSSTGIALSSDPVSMLGVTFQRTTKEISDSEEELQEYFTVGSVTANVNVQDDYPTIVVGLFDGENKDCGTGYSPLTASFVSYQNDVKACAIPPTGLEYDAAKKNLSIHGIPYGPAVRKMHDPAGAFVMTTLDSVFGFDTGDLQDYQKTNLVNAAALVLGRTQYTAKTGAWGESPNACTENSCIMTNTAERDRTIAFAAGMVSGFNTASQKSDEDYQYGPDLFCTAKSITVSDTATVTSAAGYLDEEYGEKQATILQTFTQPASPTGVGTLVCDAKANLVPGLAAISCLSKEYTSVGWTVAAGKQHDSTQGTWPQAACAYHTHQYATTLSHPCLADFESTIEVTQDQYAVDYSTSTTVNTTSSIITNRYDAAMKRPVTITVTIPRAIHSAGAYGLFDDQGNSLCSQQGGTWTCDITVQTTDAGRLSARENGNNLLAEVKGTVYVASSCSGTTAQYTSEELTLNVRVSDLSVIRDAIDVEVHSANTLLGSTLAPAFTATRWRTNPASSSTAKLPWDLTQEVMPEQVQNYTITMTLDAVISTLKFKRDAWTGMYAATDCEQFQTTRLGVLDTKYVESASCSDQYAVEYNGVKSENTVLDDEQDTLDVDIGDVCNGKLFEEETDPMLFHFTQAGTDVKTLRIVIKCGPGAVQLGLQSFASTAFQSFGTSQETSYSLQGKEQYIMRNPFTHMKFHLIQTGTGMNPHLDFQITDGTPPAKDFKHNDKVDFNAGSCNTVKDFTVTYGTQTWRFSVPCVRTGGPVTEQISLDYEASLDWTTAAAPQILLTGGEGSRNYLTKTEITTCPAGTPLGALVLGNSSDSTEYDAFPSYADEEAAVKAIKDESVVTYSGNDLVMTTHLLQVYTHKGETFCESRQLVFTLLYRKEHTVRVTILQNEQFETNGTITAFAWGAACAQGHTLSMTAEIGGDDMKDITTDMATYTSGAKILYVPDSTDNFANGVVADKTITESVCVAPCTGDTTQELKFGLLKHTTTAILAAQYTFTGTISCYDDDADTAYTGGFNSVVKYEYSTNLTSCADDCDIPVVGGNHTVDFQYCHPDSCEVRLTLSDDSWVNIVVESVTVNGVPENSPSEVVVFTPKNYAGTEVEVIWTYVRSTGGRRLRTTRRLSASGEGTVRILDYSMMEGDFAVEGDTGAEAGGEGGEGVAFGEPGSHHDFNVVFVIVGIVVAAAMFGIYVLYKSGVCQNCPKPGGSGGEGPNPPKFRSKQTYNRIVRTEY